MARESVAKTFTVAVVLCVVCSLLVSSAAVLLRPLQEANKKLNVRKNVLLAAGLATDETSGDEINRIYDEQVKEVAVQLGTYETVDRSSEDYDPKEARNNPAESIDIRKYDGPRSGLPRREKINFVYQITEGDSVKTYVLPIAGKGLWSTLYGFIALDKDCETVIGISYYEHGETPGLGGEVENEQWKKKWEGKEIYDDRGEPAIQLVKVAVNESTPDAQHKVDALSGATITSNGVQKHG